jgi:hypothetical protein
MSKIQLEIDLEIPSLKGFEPQQAAKALWEIVKNYDFEPLREIAGINVAEHKKEVAARLEEQGMSAMWKGDMQYAHNDKIEKLVFGWNVIRDAMVIVILTAWPRDEYDFPTLGTTWDESQKHVHMIADFKPMTDIVMNDWYQEKYLDPFEPIYKQYTDLLDAPPEQLPWFRAQAGPYVIAGRPKADPERATIKRALDCLVTYTKYWFEEILPNAEPVTDPTYREQVKARKEKVREIFRRQDPGGPVMNAILGKELAWRGVKILF